MGHTQQINLLNFHLLLINGTCKTFFFSLTDSIAVRDMLSPEPLRLRAQTNLLPNNNNKRLGQKKNDINGLLL